MYSQNFAMKAYSINNVILAIHFVVLLQNIQVILFGCLFNNV